jgi:toxin ParE1/3/4
VGRALKRESALRDLTAQWVWYAENAGIDVADQFLGAVEDTLEVLSMNPEIGVSVEFARPELAGMRRFPVGGTFEKILLFYLPCSEGIDLVRVIHGSRDLPRLFED